MARGKFIVIEGLDRSGKTTQHARLCARLESQGQKVLSLRFPDRNTPIGNLISSYLQQKANIDDHAVHLLFSANRWESAPRITAALDQGIHVIVDRYIYSGIVYSVAKGHVNMGINWALGPDVGLPRPDLTVFLDLSPIVARQRGGFGEERYENAEMQEKVRSLFFEVINLEKEHRGIGCTTVIDANRSVDELERVTEELVMSELDREGDVEKQRFITMDR